MSDLESVPDQGEWTKLGMVTTGNGMLAIVPPYYGGALNEFWQRDFLPRLDRVRAGLAPRLRPQFEEVKLRQTTSSVTNPGGYEDRESALLFDTPGNGGWSVEGRFGTLYGDDVSLLEVRVRFDGYDEEDDDGSWDASPPLPRFDSSFGHLLKFALTDWCDLGRFKDRRIDDLLFHEYDPERDRDFHGFVQGVMFEDWQQGGPRFGEPFPEHDNCTWALMVVQAAIHARDPERIARILDVEARYEVEHTEWVDEAGNPVEMPAEDKAALLAWPSEWRRVSGRP